MIMEDAYRETRSGEDYLLERLTGKRGQMSELPSGQAQKLAAWLLGGNQHSHTNK
ncbi:hypothetical protein BofuT4_uP119900.1 [Botrytis cinerea T4]|uniref:Uncharacterized protein n=1 Tax=Botryotinia fuckeliana (strain T4) TaxID=999810 RepID=G2XXU7_BOTF4|nr:hypothetical protein BofuT4_uP119900.1 [Botrytis cinerea T4]